VAQKVRHQHQFSAWKLHKQGPNSDLPDEEYIKSLRLEPFWIQRCSCGHEHYYRSSTKPLRSFSFMKMWKGAR
jgi:hypothetical protein